MKAEQGQASGIENSIRQTMINQLIQSNEKTFEHWKTTISEPHLDIPEEALRYLIPTRALELSDDPQKVKIRILDKNKGWLKFFIIEEKPKLLLPGEDPKLDAYKTELADGRLTRHDHIITRIGLAKTSNLAEEPILKVTSYFTHEDKQRQGIGTEFYSRLRLTAKKVGFEYIEGLNDPENNLRFFTEKLGRVIYKDLPEHIKPKFAKSFVTRTYDILNPLSNIRSPEATL